MKITKRTILLPLTLLFFVLNIFGQDVDVINGSFEGIPNQGINNLPFQLNGWYDCGKLRFPTETPPDVHPGGFWENQIAASEGRTYLGMVVRDNDSYEGVAQRLSQVLEGNQCYTFKLKLSRSSTYISQSRLEGTSANYTKPAVLRIWGGNGFCNDRELLAESTPVDHADWKTYEFKIKPKSEYRYILLEAYYKVPVMFPYSGHILVDAMSNFLKITCPDQIEEIVENNAKSQSTVATVLPPHKRNRLEDAIRKPEPKVVEQLDTPKIVAKTKILEDLDMNKLKAGSTVEIKNLYFKADTADINEASYEVLAEIIDFMKNNKNISLEIGGHTNGIPPANYCDELSTARAKAVYEYLVKNGVNPQKLAYKGYGKRKRLAADTSAEGRRKNQRVELKVIAIG
jgi:outer membrane protein OmpA-like peptidoglycan-associated protein